MRIKILIFLIVLLFISLPKVWSQSVPFFAEPALSLSKSLQGRWSANSKLVFRQQVANLENNQLSGLSQTDVIELQFFINYRLLGSKRLTLGYLYGLDEPFLNSAEMEHRLMQQFTFESGNRFKWVNRIRLEQRIGESQFRNRLRYRLTFDEPLSGDKIDPLEWYFVAGDEWLYTFTGVPGEDHMENRLHAGLGYVFSNGQKLQMEMQYRLIRIGAARQSSAWHLLLTYNLKL